MSYTIQGGTILPVAVILDSASPITIVDCPQVGAIVVGIWAAKVAGTPTLTLETFDGATSVYLRYQQAFDSTGEYQREAIIRLKVGQSLRATASVADQIHIHASYIRLDSTARG